MDAPVDWLPPILMLAAGLVIGVIVAGIVARRGRSAAGAVAAADAASELSDLQLELRDLDAKKEDLLSLLREMEDTAAKREPAQLAIERYAAELETAEVLQSIDRLRGEVSAPAGKGSRGARTTADAELETAEEGGPPRGIKGFVWGIASAAAIGALVMFVSDSASDRAQGGSVTGGPQMSGGQASPASDPDLAQAVAAVNAHPDNIDARVDLAYQYLLREDFMNAFEQTQLALQQNPDEPRALTYQSLVRLAMGQTALAGTMLERAIEVDPDLLEPRVYLALTYAQAGRFDDAMAQIGEAKTRNPADASRLDDIVAEIEMRRATGAVAPTPASEDDPHASLLPPPPSAGDPPAAAIAPVGGPDMVTGTITLSPGVTVQPGAQLYVIVRSSEGGGPPAAVSRMTAGAFPMSFSLSAANSMMGDALPDRMKLEARVDLDGNVMTRDAGAPTGELDDVARGSSGVTIVLR
jgi:tetratricopeptide (TPR) repeat protein